MGKLNRCRCYLIGHMQYQNGEAWREKVKKALNPLGVITYDPYHKPFINEIKEDEAARNSLNEWMDNGEFDKVTERMKQVRSDDLRLCDVSDFLIAHINPMVASWGSAEEIFTSNRMKKPIFLSIEGGKKKAPLWLMGTIPHKYFYNDIDEIIDKIQQIDSGEKELDNGRWRLLRPEYR